MSRKVTVKLEITMQINIEEGISISEFMDEMDYDIDSFDNHGEVLDTEVINWEVVDSK